MRYLTISLNPKKPFVSEYSGAQGRKFLRKTTKSPVHITQRVSPIINLMDFPFRQFRKKTLVISRKAKL